MRGWFCCALVLFFAACEQEQITESEPASWERSIGRLVIDGKELKAAQFERRRGARTADGTMTIVPVDDAEFSVALRLETLRQPLRMDSLEASLATQVNVEEGAACWLHLRARAVQPQVETGLARLAVSFRPTEIEKDPLLDYEIYIEPTWTSIDIPFNVSEDLSEGQAKISLGVGTQVQVIDIGNIVVRCFDPDSVPSDLPKTTFTYSGRASDAPWRKIAEGRIDRYRKGDLLVKVVDSDDQPVPDAEVQLQMTRHAFKFGAAVDANLLAGSGEDDQEYQYSEEDVSRYRKILNELFNTVTFEDSMSWTAWSDTAKRRVTEEALSWIDSMDLALRGSALVPIDWSGLPEDLQEKRDDPSAVRIALRDRVSETVGDLRGRISEWDVVDRPRGRHDLLELLGSGEMDEWFRLARAADDQPKLFLTESEVLHGDRLVQLVNTLDRLTKKSVPIDALGIKGHFKEQPPSIQVLSDRLDQLASFDLPIMITEFDMETDDPALYSDFTRDLMTLAFSHPSVEGFVFWGFWEGKQDIPTAAMYQRDWTINPIGEVYRDLVLRKWWTDEVALSNAEGDLLTRAFLGAYTITARKDELSATASVTLDADGTSVTLKLDKPNSG